MSADRRDALLQAGSAAYLAAGVNGTGISDIVERAGMPKGSFYNYFPSKDAFTAAVAERYAAENLAHLDAILADPLGSPRERLLAWIGAVRAHLAGRQCAGGCLIGAIALESTAEQGEVRTALRGAFARWIGRLTEAVAAAQAAGEVRSEPPASSVARVILAAVEGAIMIAKVEGRPDALDDLRAVLGATVLAGPR